ncbi:MAG: ChbG/HpnK family deacetylase [Xanthobacteraceae bacterium]|nr:ChbG/HpnK family deacetylase [Xanthobacteraceae bacterium]MBX3548656.1 ChbG/HpnK family deacetylase [Xanthobacteraceae bacterium]
MKRIVVCADDYNLAPGVSRAIRELIAAGRLNATSVMTLFPGLKEEAASLLATPAPAPLQIGLHLTLSGGFAPLAASPIATPDGKLPSLAELHSPKSHFKLSRDNIAAEIEAQLSAFQEAFGRAPDYVDGHHHCQLVAGIQSIFLETVARRAPGAWVRQCAPARTHTLLTADNKTRFLGLLSLRFRRLARKAGVPVNPSFSGAYDYFGSEKFDDLIPRFINELTDGGVMMCHPGYVDDVLRARDILLAPREAEYFLLASERFPIAMKAAGATLA